MSLLLKLKNRLNSENTHRQNIQVDIPTERELLNLITNIYNYKLGNSYMLILDKIINESDTADIAADITQSLSNSYWQKLKNITTQLEQTLYNHITNKTYRFNTFILSRYINQTINTKLKINKNNSINILSLIGLNVFNAIRSDAKDLLPATYDIGAIDNLTITPTLFIMQDKNTFISPQASLFYTMVLKTSSNYFYINASSKTIDELGEIKNFIFYDLNKYNDYMEETK